MEDNFMSQQEAERYRYLMAVQDGEITSKTAANLINLSERQVRRLLRQFSKDGINGLISKKRGKSSNNRFDSALRDKALNLICTVYNPVGAGPTFISEQLWEKHKIKISKETVRNMMIENHLWQPEKQRGSLHPRRPRKECRGEMLILDASKHAWFGNDKPMVHLHAAIDDATSEWVAGFFSEEETTEAYFRMLYPYLQEMGVPVSFYVDKRGCFKVNMGDDPTALTQFGRAMSELNIRLIFANSPQAKGRVERLFGTLQDRLVKIFMLEKVSSIIQANELLSCFMKDHNNRFGVKPKSTVNGHRPLKHKEQLEYILCEKHQRTCTKDLSIQFEGQFYQIVNCKTPRRLQNAKLTVIKTLNGRLEIAFNEQLLKYVQWADNPHPVVLEQHKLKIEKINRRFIGGKKANKPSPEHPWRHRQKVAEEKDNAQQKRLSELIEISRVENLEIANIFE